MSTESVYSRQAISNENTARAAQNGFPDWAVTMCFYAALHWVNHYAYINNEIKQVIPQENNTNDSTHKIKRNYIEKICRLNARNGFQDVEKAYKFLFNQSMKSRYLQDLDEDVTAREYYAQNTNEVKSCFDKLSIIKSKLS
jgi:hypothetical protein